MSPFGEEMQKDDPSTKVTVPAPSGPAAVSAFHPAILGSLYPLNETPHSAELGASGRIYHFNDPTPVFSLVLDEADGFPDAAPGGVGTEP